MESKQDNPGPPTSFAPTNSARDPLVEAVGKIRAWHIAAAGAAMFIVPVAGHYLAVQSWGNILVLHITPFLLLPACFGLPVSILVAIFKRDQRGLALRCLLFAMVFLGLFMAGEWLGMIIRRNAFQQLAIESAGLVSAIAAYQVDHGVPPLELGDLVPAYLAKVPRTGLGAYPEYTFLSGARAQEWGGNSWVLYVDCGVGGLNFDRFIYLPLQNYPKYGYGGAIERMGTWGYVHE